MIEIDGSEGEGGGQIIRTALALSSITKKPVRIYNIRAKRPKSGLQPQHLMAVKAVRSICRGEIKGAELESKELEFIPGEIVGGRYDFNIGTAGSTTLVAQTILPILLFAEKKSNISITGGTHVMKSPSYDYFEQVFVPAIASMGAEVKSAILKSGYYPKGGGEIQIEVTPSELEGNETWKTDQKTRVLIRISKLPMHIAIREKKVFVQNGIEDVEIIEETALDVGNALLAWKGFNGVYKLGEKGKRAESVAQETLEELNKENEEVDKHLADQLLLYACLAKGKTSYSTSEITEHLRTNIAIVRKFLEKEIKISKNRIEIS